MKIFEFSFNPKKSKNRFFEIFSYEPTRSKERSKGSLYVVGELQNALELQGKFLRTLSQVIQQEYYDSSFKTPQAALKASLKKANLFLQQEAKAGNVHWLGNLHIAILLFITVQEKRTHFHLAKAGSIKVVMGRGGMVIDVGKKLEKAGKQKHPSKIFGTVVSGTALPEDTIVVITKDIYDMLLRENSVTELVLLKEGKRLKGFFKTRQRMFSQLSGLLFHVVMEEMQPLSFLPKPKLMLQKGVKLPTLKLGLQFLLLRHPAALKKQLIPILFLLAVLLLGFLLFG
tara:strand:- start:1953 stop:2810 length:858 start_codon:yes stop_codon:yes gene_type:complete